MLSKMKLNFKFYNWHHLEQQEDLEKCPLSDFDNS